MCESPQHKEIMQKRKLAFYRFTSDGRTEAGMEYGLETEVDAEIQRLARDLGKEGDFQKWFELYFSDDDSVEEALDLAYNIGVRSGEGRGVRALFADIAVHASGMDERRVK